MLIDVHAQEFEVPVQEMETGPPPYAPECEFLPSWHEGYEPGIQIADEGATARTD